MTTTKTKYLYVTMPDGSAWSVPAEIVAKSIAGHYEEEGTPAYETEFDDAMASAVTLIDWAENNMNWSDVEHVALEVKKAPKPDFQEGWMNGKKRIVEE